MRIPLGKVWRAFSELDPYTDDECQRYMKQAMKRRFLGIVVLAPVGFFGGVGVSFGAFFGIVLLLKRISVPMPDWVDIPLAVITFALTLAPPFMGCLLARDFWLRRAIRARLDRAVCDACRYSLLGLSPLTDPATGNDAVQCPECGTHTPLDGSRLSHGDLMPGAEAPPTTG